MSEEFNVDIVVSSSAAEASVNSFDASLARVDTRSASLSKQLQLVVDNTQKLGDDSGADRLAKDLNDVEREAGSAARELDKVTQSSTKLNSQRGGGQLADDLRKVKTPAEDAAQAVDQLQSRVAAYAVAAAAAVTTALFVGIIKEGDAYALLEDRIDRATRATGDFKQVRDSLFDTAFQAGTAVETTLKVFEAINRSRTELNASTDDILDVTRAVQQLGVISGASRDATNNALRQLAQGFSSDFLRAEEFNSVLENTPEIAFRIADGLDLGLGTLQQMVRDGELLSSSAFASLLKQTEDINDELDDMPIRLGRAFAQLEQAGDEAFFQLDRALGGGDEGASGAVAGFFADLAKGLRIHTQNLEALNSYQSSVDRQFQEAEQRLTELQNEDVTFYTARHAAEITAQEQVVEALREKIRVRDEEAAADKLQAETRKQELADAKAIADADKLRKERAENLEAVLKQTRTEIEKIAKAEENRNKIITDNTDEGSSARAKLLQDSADLAEAARQKIAEKELAAEQKRADALTRIRKGLATDLELIAIEEAETIAAIREVTDEGSTEREELITAAQADASRARIDLKKDEYDELRKLQEDFAKANDEALEKSREDAAEAFELELELARENELRRLEGRAEVTSLAQADELADLQAFEDAKIAITTQSAGQFQRVAIDLIKFQKLSTTEQASFALGTLASLTANFDSESKKMFTINKVLRVGQAIIDGKAAVQSTYAGTPGGLAVKAAAATAMGVIAAANVAQIAGQSFGGGSGGSFGGGALGSGEINIPDAPTVGGDTQTEAGTVTAPTVAIYGNVYSNDSEEFAEQVGPSLVAWQSNEIAEGDLVVTPSNSREALDLTG